MKNRPGVWALSATAAVLLLSGCGTVGEFVLGTLRRAVVAEARSATSQAAEQAAFLIEAAVSEAAETVVLAATSQAAQVIEDGLEMIRNPDTSGATLPP